MGNTGVEACGRKPKLTDAERHKRFLDMARAVEVSDDPKDFDKAFECGIP
jgi:hypothetical protein